MRKISEIEYRLKNKNKKNINKNKKKVTSDKNAIYFETSYDFE